MIFRYLTFVLPVMVITGCDRAPQGFPQVVPCTITVVKGDTPLPEVTLMFVAEGGNAWFTAANSDKSGIAECRTFLGDYSRSGAPAGKYKVTLSQLPQVTPQFTQQQLFDMSPQEKAAEQQRMKKLLAESRSFPVAFESAATTPVVIEVEQPKSTIRLDVSEWIDKK